TGFATTANGDNPNIEAEQEVTPTVQMFAKPLRVSQPFGGSNPPLSVEFPPGVDTARPSPPSERVCGVFSLTVPCPPDSIIPSGTVSSRPVPSPAVGKSGQGVRRSHPEGPENRLNTVTSIEVMCSVLPAGSLLPTHVTTWSRPAQARRPGSCLSV